MTVRKEEKLRELEEKLNPQQKSKVCGGQRWCIPRPDYLTVAPQQFKGFSADDAPVPTASEPPQGAGSARGQDVTTPNANVVQPQPRRAVTEEAKEGNAPEQSKPLAAEVPQAKAAGVRIGEDSSVKGLWQSLVHHGSKPPPNPSSAAEVSESGK